MALTEKLTERVLDRLPAKVRETAYLRAFGLLKVPMILFTSPSVLELSSERCEIRIPLNRRTRNHLKSLYFGALAVGADCAGGIIAMKLIREAKADVSLLFKDFHAEFLKRAEGDVHFTCSDGPAIAEGVRKALASGERENCPVRVVATVPSKLGDEPVAKFTLTLSLKKKR